MEILQNKFAFFANFAETIRELPTEKKARAYQALCEYGIYGILPDDESLRTMCLMARASLFKEDGRKSNGGNHNPTGKNQYTKPDGQSGQSWSKLVKVGQSGQFLSETKTEAKTETEIKEKIIKKKNLFTPPTLDEVKTYCAQRGIVESIAVKIFDYYTALDWRDSQGKKIEKWKAKIISVWDKPENHIEHTKAYDPDDPEHFKL